MVVKRPDSVLCDDVALLLLHGERQGTVHILVHHFACSRITTYADHARGQYECKEHDDGESLFHESNAFGLFVLQR